MKGSNSVGEFPLPSRTAAATLRLPGARFDQPGARHPRARQLQRQLRVGRRQRRVRVAAAARPRPRRRPTPCSCRSSRCTRSRRGPRHPLRVRSRPGTSPPPTARRSCCPAPPAPASARRRTASDPASCTSPSHRRTAAAWPRVLSAPTVSAAGVFPGEMTPPTIGRPSSVFPMLPAAATTTRPALTARSTAWHSGSSR